MGMTKLSRRLLFSLVGIISLSLFRESSTAATKKTGPKKRVTPTPNVKKPTSSPAPLLEGTLIAKSSDLLLRQPRIFFLKDSFGVSTSYSLTRTSRGIVAFDTRCTHAGAQATLNGTQLHCAAHGSLFNPESGEVIRGPAYEPLKSYKTVEVDGEIRIIIP